MPRELQMESAVILYSNSTDLCHNPNLALFFILAQRAATKSCRSIVSKSSPSFSPRPDCYPNLS